MTTKELRAFSILAIIFSILFVVGDMASTWYFVHFLPMKEGNWLIQQFIPHWWLISLWKGALVYFFIRYCLAIFSHTNKTFILTLFIIINVIVLLVIFNNIGLFN